MALVVLPLNWSVSRFLFMVKDGCSICLFAQWVHQNSRLEHWNAIW